jgi:drug/metabolite transporter (DMT)-like permease
MDGHRALARTGAAGGMIVVGAANGALALLVGFPLFTAQALRYGLAAAVFAIVVGCRGLLRPLPTPRQLGRLALLAATGLFGFTTLSLVALAHGDPASVGAVVGCTPLLLAVLAPRSRGVRPSARMVSAACVVVVGATIVQGFGHFDGLGLLAALGVLCCEAAFSLLAVPLLPSLGALRVSLWETALATPMLLLAAGRARRRRRAAVGSA